jgi:hypothetical protein
MKYEEEDIQEFLSHEKEINKFDEETKGDFYRRML